MSNTIARVWELSNCDLCKLNHRTVKAKYDAKTRDGRWAYLCDYHFKIVGVGLGLGKGQKLILRDKGGL